MSFSGYVRLVVFLSLVCLGSILISSSVKAWVHGHQPFPGGEATVVLDHFCLITSCPGSPQVWHQRIRAALDAWDAAGSDFIFHTRSSRPNENPCASENGTVTVILTHASGTCPGDSAIPRGVGGAAATVNGAARVYLNMDRTFLNPEAMYARLLVHEFGHVLGLDHPNEHGQDVDTIMNRDLRYSETYTPTNAAPRTIRVLADTPRSDDIAGVRALYGARTASGTPRVALEAPIEEQTLTGVGLIRGWACEAATVAISVDSGPRIPAATGNPRGDTQTTCGHADTGFVLLVNWNNFGPGEHTLDLYADNRLVASRTVTVLTYGEPFLQGLDGEWVLEDWPEPGTDTTVAWNEAIQNIEIVNIDRPEELTGCPGWGPSHLEPGTFQGFTTAWVQQCLDAGAGPNAREDDGSTPLHYVAWIAGDNADAARLLIEHGANVNTKDRGGYTPLHLAAGWPDNYAIVVALLQAGADPNARTNAGETPLDYHDGYGLDGRIEAALLAAGGQRTGN